MNTPTNSEALPPPAGSASSLVEKRGDVWMMSSKPCQSCAREIAEIAMRSLGLDATDFRLRDTVIIAISDTVGAMLDAAHDSQNATTEAR